MTKYRIEHRYPTDKWVDIKGFGDRESAESLLNSLNG